MAANSTNQLQSNRKNQATVPMPSNMTVPFALQTRRREKGEKHWSWTRETRRSRRRVKGELSSKPQAEAVGISTNPNLASTEGAASNEEERTKATSTPSTKGNSVNIASRIVFSQTRNRVPKSRRPAASRVPGS